MRISKSRWTVFALLILLAVSIMMAAAAVPTGTEVVRDKGGRLIDEATVSHPLAWLYVTFVLTLLVMAATALVAYVRRDVRLARRLLLITGVLGIVPTIFPGLIALLTRAQMARVEGTRG
ncbi:hypothetical protein [Verrucosispora sioxanthis]|uniref:hypothetical protein n=1 Tax=Verrucosispora sioxanthis TaxID=2499994 RepID=UPI001C122CCD|nr:hypothetical protein [Verrucosispora sioxanthis]